MQEEPWIVRAVDVGYRNCKFVERVDGDRIVCQVFPSIAPVASGRDLGVDRATRRNTMTIPVGKVRYEVGAEAALAQATDDTRNLDDMYVLTDPYLAIVRGALRSMRVPRVDLLMVGLPVSLFKKRRTELERRLQGDHDLGDGKTVNVARVKAMAQPMGAFLGYAVPHAQRDAMLRERNVIVDPGWRTFDWVVTQSLKVLDKRSDAVNKGMFAVVHAIADSVGTELGSRLSMFDHDRIDAALRTKTPAKFFGQALDLEPFIDAGKRVVHEAITEMRQVVQDGSDIDNFVLAGGAAFFYRGELQKAFPKHRILQVDEPLFANVRGFQIAGMEIMAAAARGQNLGQWLQRFNPFRLHWNPESFLRLAYMLSSQAGLYSAVKRAEDLHIDQLKAELEHLWGKKMGGEKSKEAHSARWVYAALCDLRGNVQARDLVRFLRIAADEESKRAGQTWSDRVLAPESMRKAIPLCSVEKVNEAKAEIASLRNWVEVMTQQHIRNLKVPFSAAQAGLNPELLAALQELGVVYEDLDGNLGEDRLYLPEIYRSGLGIETSAAGRPRMQALLKKNIGTIPL